ncbi:hypothetical protein [Sandaracinus amylolyticus]|uniref:hypothetical protein n=1 Tax=Sandaracinus amylolyticus TaxID=927083 RepID=UPI001F468776|nr:hypothetical protein [Sandaracinus amylolyticus]UJR82562.1 Hypothetical protein I5071_46270 [Sandaracinus amylolyticus]
MALALVLSVGCASGGGDRTDSGATLEDAPPSSSIDAPIVDGEPRADHRRPSWTWSVPEGATAFRLRVDGGLWGDVPLATTTYTAITDLVDGRHTFEVQARDAMGGYGPSGTFETDVVVREGGGWWRQDRVMATTPYEHVAAISAHNAYEDGLATAAENLDATLARMHAAQTAGADLIELDLVDGGEAVLIDHDDTGATARAALSDVLDDPMLREGDQVLFLEIKESTASEPFVRRLLDVIAAHRADYARAGRHVVLRAFHSVRTHLDMARALLDSDEYALLRPYVRLSVLFERNAATAELVSAAASNGYDMVELEYMTRELMTHVVRARALGLGVNVFTVPVAFGEVFVANARESVDAITVDYPVASARAVVEDDNALFFVDASRVTDASTTTIPWYRADTTAQSLAVGRAGAPLLRIGASTDALVFGHLVFESSATRAAPLYDADARAGEGVLLATVVRFARTTIADGTTMSVIAKSDTGAWALELFDAAGEPATVLRFGVYVGGGYQYATVPATALTTTRAHFVTCAYDGDGGVRMWIDDDDTAVTVVSTTGEIANNDVPATLGADPQADGTTRFHFDGAIQMALMQAWGPH